jgi:hypothetical protein
MFSGRAFKPRNENSHRADEWKRCEPFLKWLRGRTCFLALQSGSHECFGKVRSCHYDPWGDKGMGTKVSDNACLPMCDGAHSEQHNIGWPKFEAQHKFDGRHVITAYWLQWRDGTSMGAAWKKKQEGLGA